MTTITTIRDLAQAIRDGEDVPEAVWRDALLEARCEYCAERHSGCLGRAAEDGESQCAAVGLILGEPGWLLIRKNFSVVYDELRRVGVIQ